MCLTVGSMKLRPVSRLVVDYGVLVVLISPPLRAIFFSRSRLKLFYARPASVHRF
jgi:hypothetical protein